MSPPLILLSTFTLFCFVGNFIRVIQLCLADDSSEFLNAHNIARIDVGVRNLTWDNGVAAFAELYDKQHVNDYRIAHSNIGPYGENVVWSKYDMLPAEAVELWLSDKLYYNSSTNSCDPVDSCLKYLQVVWLERTKLGCYRVRCLDGGNFITCNYDPRASFMDQNSVCSPKRLDIRNYIPLY